MTRYYYNLVSLSLQVSILVFVGCSPTDDSESLSMNDRLQLQQLTEDFARHKVNMKEILAVNDARLVALEFKVAQLEKLIVSLQQKIDERPAVWQERTSRSTDSNNGNNKNPEVSPVVATTGMPKSCEDLKNMGHTLNGLYLVMGTEHVLNVYCNFLALPSDNSFQTRIGLVDVKSLPVYFYVQRDTHIDAIKKPNRPIPFEEEKLNIGNAMKLASGKFIAPRPGIYYFSFNGLVGFSNSYLHDSSARGVQIGIFLNGKLIGIGYGDENTMESQFEPLSLQSTLDLQERDQVWLEIVSNSEATFLASNAHFIGWLLEEKISIK